ncbi:biopolymer transporter ExbD [Lysobacter sp. HDW10]|jgi:biopolymer transport protein ExbD|uniref:ExbD/TolR family protein n=1 Tax=Lysobacter sp. HDW10 TaxID=2714936 RepID=UPI00140ACDA5|nr:biopolymer transporter ExbD [Lysobacter sp. HDW10]QIK80773.1 biopolymer transporter ExbD [Lysobacter sp. HDW10]
MAFSSGNSSGPMADINVTPLVDVMLVLLIIFMVTMPIQTYPIKIDLPQASTNPPPPNPKAPIKLRIDAAGQVFWNDAMMDVKTLEATMKDTVNQDPENQPSIQIETSNQAQYDVFAKVLAAAKNADMKKIAFVENGN